MSWTVGGGVRPRRGEGDGPPRLCASRILNLYIHGYFNRVRSRRRLEMESHRKIEVKLAALNRRRIAVVGNAC
jgi:hypothetical protein